MKTMYELEMTILEYLFVRFFCFTKDEQKEKLQNWFDYLDDSVKGDQFSSWIKNPDDFKVYNVSNPNSDEHPLDVYARYYVDMSLSAHFLAETLQQVLESDSDI